MKRLLRTRKLFGFLRAQRGELFDDAFQAELIAMYRDTGAGKDPIPPALLGMATILQAYHGMSDAEAVEMTVVDLRWQLVLDRLGADEPAFSQGALTDFRARLIRHDMDRRLLERTVALAERTKAFDPKKLPKELRVAIDSMPLEGAGRVEDTFNLLAHAARKVISAAAAVLQRRAEDIAREAGAPMLAESSIKKALDLEWSDPVQKGGALMTVVEQLDALEAWIAEHLADEAKHPPLSDLLATLRQLRDQDLEPDPSGGGGSRIRQGVAPERRVSVEDGEMRHGRKSKSKRFNGFKRHIASDLDTGHILACAVTPANSPEEEAAPVLRDDVARLSGRKSDRLAAHRPWLHRQRSGARGHEASRPRPLQAMGPAQRKALHQVGLRDRHAPKINSMPCRRGRVLRARHGRRIRPGGLQSMPTSLALHDGFARCRPYRQHRRGRAAPTPPPQTHRDPQGPAPPA